MKQGAAKQAPSEASVRSSGYEAKGLRLRTY
jgi:hypothetical protein